MKAALVLAFIRLALGYVPFRAVRRLVVGRPPRIWGGVSRQLCDDVAWAVISVSQRLPGGARTCLSQALAVQAMLAHLGHPSRMHLGVMRDEHGELAAHAWVECEGRIVIGGSASDLARFSPLTSFDLEAPESRAVERLQAGR